MPNLLIIFYADRTGAHEQDIAESMIAGMVGSVTT